MALFRDQAARIMLLLWKDHIIICGLGLKGSLLMQDFLEAGRRVLIVEQDDNCPMLEQARQMGAIVMVRDATDPQALLQAGIRRAAGFVAVTGSDETNAELAVQVESTITADRAKALHCLIHVVDPDLWDLLREWQLGLVDKPCLRVELFNIYQRGAEYLLDRYIPLTVEHLGAASTRTILIIGLGNLGRILMLTCAERFFRQRQDSQERLQLIVVDRYATSKVSALAARFPRLEDALLIRPLDLEPDSADFITGKYLEVENKKLHLETAFIFLDSNALAISTAMTLHRQLQGMDTDIVMRSSTDGGLARLTLETAAFATGFPRLNTFNLVEETCTQAVFQQGTHERLARALHEAYIRSQSKHTGDDPALLPWALLPENLREANRRQADRNVRTLHDVGLSLTLLRDWGEAPLELNAEEIEQLATLEHRRWCDEKRQLGWRFAASAKNDKAKTHPDLVDWDELPDEEKEKNRVPMRELPWLFHEAGFRISGR
jgi:hypothetical protein